MSEPEMIWTGTGWGPKQAAAAVLPPQPPPPPPGPPAGSFVPTIPLGVIPPTPSGQGIVSGGNYIPPPAAPQPKYGYVQGSYVPPPPGEYVQQGSPQAHLSPETRTVVFQPSPSRPMLPQTAIPAPMLPPNPEMNAAAIAQGMAPFTGLPQPGRTEFPNMGIPGPMPRSDLDLLPDLPPPVAALPAPAQDAPGGPGGERAMTPSEIALVSATRQAPGGAVRLSAPPLSRIAPAGPAPEMAWDGTRWAPKSATVLEQAPAPPPAPLDPIEQQRQAAIAAASRGKM